MIRNLRELGQNRPRTPTVHPADGLTLLYMGLATLP